MSYFCLFFYEKKQIKGHAFVFLIPWNKNKKIFRIILFWIKWRLADHFSAQHTPVSMVLLRVLVHSWKSAISRDLTNSDNRRLYVRPRGESEESPPTLCSVLCMLSPWRDR